MDKLETFKDWWLKTKEYRPPAKDPVYMLNHICGSTLYRKDNFQVQLFTVRPHSMINPHVHPNVDSFEVYIAGDISFMCNGKWFEQNKIEGSIRIHPSSWHGGKFGERGGIFLSIQNWLNGVEPSTVGHDWFDALNNNKGDAYNLNDKGLIYGN